MASSTPATSAKVTTVLLPRNIRARLLPKLIAWLLVPWAWRIMKNRKPPIRSTGRIAPISRLIHWPDWDASLPEKVIVDGSRPPFLAASVTSAKTSVNPMPGTITA